MERLKRPNATAWNGIDPREGGIIPFHATEAYDEVTQAGLHERIISTNPSFFPSKSGKSGAYEKGPVRSSPMAI